MRRCLAKSISIGVQIHLLDRILHSLGLFREQAHGSQQNWPYDLPNLIFADRTAVVWCHILDKRHAVLLFDLGYGREVDRQAIILKGAHEPFHRRYLASLVTFADGPKPPLTVLAVHVGHGGAGELGHTDTESE